MRPNRSPKLVSFRIRLRWTAEERDPIITLGRWISLLDKLTWLISKRGAEQDLKELEDEAEGRSRCVTSERREVLVLVIIP